jgi:hypothetical protein
MSNKATQQERDFAIVMEQLSAKAEKILPGEMSSMIEEALHQSGAQRPTAPPLVAANIAEAPAKTSSVNPQEEFLTCCG